jgi:Mn2+/Fe2+ NRAMP family transporter
MRSAMQLMLGILTAIGGFLDVGALATAGSAGSKFGFGLVWALLLGTACIILLLLQVGRLTAVSGKPYASAIREHFGFKFFLLPLSAELLANSIMLAAELGGVAVALSLLTGVSWHLMLPVAPLLVFALVWRGPFTLVENGPALFGLVTLCFVVGAVVVGVSSATRLPELAPAPLDSSNVPDYLFLAAAILGAIISPYLVYFYSSGAREEHWTSRSLRTNVLSSVGGMGFGCVTALAVIALAAMVLRPMHVETGTLGELGLTLSAPWGKVGGLLFAVSLFAACYGAAVELTLAVPYMVSQGFGWELGENHPPAEAPRFNLVLICFLLAGTAVGLIGIDPLQLTLYGSALTAVLLPVSLSPFLVLMNDREALGRRTNGRLMNVATIAILVVAAVVAIVSLPLLVVTGGA